MQIDTKKLYTMLLAAMAVGYHAAKVELGNEDADSLLENDITRLDAIDTIVGKYSDKQGNAKSEAALTDQQHKTDSLESDNELDDFQEVMNFLNQRDSGIYHDEEQGPDLKTIPSQRKEQQGQKEQETDLDHIPLNTPKQAIETSYLETNEPMESNPTSEPAISTIEENTDFIKEPKDEAISKTNDTNELPQNVFAGEDKESIRESTTTPVSIDDDVMPDNSIYSEILQDLMKEDPLLQNIAKDNDIIFTDDVFISRHQRSQYFAAIIHVVNRIMNQGHYRYLIYRIHDGQLYSAHTKFKCPDLKDVTQTISKIDPEKKRKLDEELSTLFEYALNEAFTTQFKTRYVALLREKMATKPSRLREIYEYFMTNF